MGGGAPGITAQDDSTPERLRLSRTGFARGGDMKGTVGLGDGDILPARPQSPTAMASTASCILLSNAGGCFEGAPHAGQTPSDGVTEVAIETAAEAAEPAGGGGTGHC